MNMKKITTLALAVLLILPAQIFAASVTIEQLQEQIKALQAQITQMSAELSATKKDVAVIKEELRITKTLKHDMSDEEVIKLQEFLSTMPDIYPEGMVTGYFGSLTEKAVKKWQGENGLESVGIVGPKTRAKLGELSGKIPSPNSSMEGLRATTTPRGLENREEHRPTTTPSGTVPATPAIPPSGGGRGATPATPATPAEPEPDTTAPTISNAQTTNITETSATITWTTNEPASSEVYYAASSTPIFATTTTKVVGSDSITSHSVNLSNLTAPTIYYYVVVSKDVAGNVATSSEQTFTTLTPSPPPAPISEWSNAQITNFIGDGNIYYGEYPAADWNGTGYGVVWEGNDGTPEIKCCIENIFYRKIDPEGNILGDPVKITNHGYSGTLTAAAPNIVWNGSKYGVAWTDNNADGNGQNLRFATLDSNGNKLTDIVLTVPNDNTNANRPGLKWTGTVFALAWQGTSRFYAEVGGDGQTVVVGKKIATDNEWDSVNTNDFIGTTISSGGKIYFSDTNINQELVSTVSGSNTWPFITWNGTKYGIVWMNVQNNQLQLYFGTK
jgi:peptidoglycan hydrolase-like protein with peptidoglycan-binding domain